MIDYDKSIVAIDEWLKSHDESMPFFLFEPTEKLFMDVLGVDIKLSPSDDMMMVMSKLHVMLMREIIKYLKKC